MHQFRPMCTSSDHHAHPLTTAHPLHDHCGPFPPIVQGATNMATHVWRRISRRLHVPKSQKEKREVLTPLRLAVAKIFAGTPIQVGPGPRLSSHLGLLCGLCSLGGRVGGVVAVLGGGAVHFGSAHATPGWSLFTWPRQLAGTLPPLPGNPAKHPPLAAAPPPPLTWRQVPLAVTSSS